MVYPAIYLFPQKEVNKALINGKGEMLSVQLIFPFFFFFLRMELELKVFSERTALTNIFQVQRKLSLHGTKSSLLDLK